MADGTSIEWTNSTWNPIRGCSRVSPGCGGPSKQGGCYAEIMAARFSKPGQWGHGYAEMVGSAKTRDHRWTGKVDLVESQLLLPMKWRAPRRIFVNSTSDLFHENLSDAAIDRVFAVMALCPQHTFQILTKRPKQMRDYMTNVEREAYWMDAVAALIQSDKRLSSECHAILAERNPWVPLPNVWLGVSVEDQERADERVPHLLATPAAVRFLSCEPLLGLIHLRKLRRDPDAYDHAMPGFDPSHFFYTDALTGADGVEYSGAHAETLKIKPSIDWVIAGGESGPGARPMHPDWARSLRDQCVAAEVPFFFKQWGEYVSVSEEAGSGKHFSFPDGATVRRVGKGAAGAQLDGREHKDFPAALAA